MTYRALLVVVVAVLGCDIGSGADAEPSQPAPGGDEEPTGEPFPVDLYEANRLTTGCPENQVCDPGFAINPSLQHPNVDILRAVESQAVRYAIGDSGTSEPPVWAWGEHWSSFPLIADQAGSVVTPGDAAAPTSLAEFFLRKAMELPGSETPNASELADVAVYSSKTKAVFFNPHTSGPTSALLGRTTIAVHTYKETIFPDSYRALKSDGTVAQLSSLMSAGNAAALGVALSPILLRDEYGQQENLSGMGACQVDEQTYSAEPSRYCKWTHFGAGQSFKTPGRLGIPLGGKGIDFGVSFRVFGIQDSPINQYLHAAGESAHYIHFNMRLNVIRERARPVEYYDLRAKKTRTKTHDRISINIPLFEASDLCESTQWSSLPYCKREAKHPAARSFVHDRPDWGTLQFMFKMGRLDQFGADSTSMRKRIADGKWVRLEFDALPNLQSELARAIAVCDSRHESWGMPEAACDVESTNIGDYSIAATSFGWEVRGAWTAAIALKQFRIRVTE